MFDFFADAELIDAMAEATRDESAMIAQRLMFIGELDARRAKELAECRLWSTDPYEGVAAEVAVALNISRGRARGQVSMARVLRDELPCVAKVFARGEIDYRMVDAIIARTENVDGEIKDELDAAIAGHCVKWMRMSTPKLRDRIDLWVTKFDPAAVRVPAKEKDSQYIEVSERGPGMACVYGHVEAAKAALFDARLDALADTVCGNDPRSKDQRRVDALTALARYEATLACLCGSDTCQAVTEREGLREIAIHVLAEQATLDGTSDAPGYLAGFGVQPAESVREMVAAGATVKPLRVPGGDPAPGYRPTAAQAAFVRWRDLTCRFPGCDKPAEVCDIDHTVAYPYGPTHPANNKLYCRSCHLLKTFYGKFGWKDRQLPDGTVVFTAPTGHTYVTEPHGAMIFPALAKPTGELGELTVPDESPHRGVMMPTRRQTREQDRRDRITKERREREQLIADEEHQRQAWLAANYEPPPF